LASLHGKWQGMRGGYLDSGQMQALARIKGKRCFWMRNKHQTKFPLVSGIHFLD